QLKEELHRKPTSVQGAQSQGLLGTCIYIRIGEAEVNKICLSFLAVTVLARPAWGQKVEVQKPDRGQILHVQTALNHLTVLELTEPVSTVAVGSPVFKVEWRENKGFIRYTIRNQSPKAYVPGTPQVVALNAPKYSESLYPLSNSQLSPDAAARLKCSGETRIEVAKGEIRSLRIEPGQETTGIVAIK